MAAHRPPRFIPARVCVQCGKDFSRERISSVIWFAESSVTLARCPSCEQYLDPYVEFDAPITVLDLALHRVPSYRHVTRNLDVKLSVWLRLYFVVLFIFVLRNLWINGSVFAVLTAELAQFAAVALLYRVLRGGAPPNAEDWVILFKTLALGKWPAILFVIGWAWGFSVAFVVVIEVYTFTTTCAALCALSRVSPLQACALATAGLTCSMAVRVLS